MATRNINSFIQHLMTEKVSTAGAKGDGSSTTGGMGGGYRSGGDNDGKVRAIRGGSFVPFSRPINIPGTGLYLQGLPSGYDEDITLLARRHPSILDNSILRQQGGLDAVTNPALDYLQGLKNKGKPLPKPIQDRLRRIKREYED